MSRTRTKPIRTIAFIVAASALGLASAASAMGRTTAADMDAAKPEVEQLPVTATTLPPSTPPTTVPTDPVPVPAGEIAPEVKIISEKMDMSIAETEEFLVVQRELVEFSNSVRDRRGYVEFMATKDGRSGILLVEPAVNRARPFAEVRVPENVEVRQAAMTLSASETARQRLEDRVKDELGDSLLGVAYDPFENTSTVHLAEGVSNEDMSTAVQVAGGPVKNLGMSVVVEETTDVGVEARGGQTVGAPAGACTTAFGIWFSGTWGYLTTGHCGLGGISINGIGGGFSQLQTIGGYVDRMRIQAGGANWLVRIHPTSPEVDMVNQVDHIVPNITYCHFGQSSDQQDCGVIDQFNQVIAGGGHQNRWASRTSNQCQTGDSGGPVWQYAAGLRYPSGMIMGTWGQNGNLGDCGYTSLKDNLNPTSWQLL